MRKEILRAVVYNFLIATLALFFTWIFGGPKIDIEFKTTFFIGAFLAAIFFVMIFTSVFFAPSRGGGVKAGPYKYIRHPICAVVIFLLNPALAVIFRSWIYLLVCAVIYFVWKSLVETEEARTAKKLDNDYRQYRLNTNLFFPDLYSISPPLYFILIGIPIFIFVFVVLNFPSLSLRYISWKARADLPSAESPSGQSINNEPRENKSETQEATYDKPDSIVIEKIGVDAPLVYVQSTDQKALNRALDNGVVIYPGSTPPGRTGNFFLTGHSSVYPWDKTIYGRIFASLDKLEVGDRVMVYFNQHKYEYEITGKHVAAPQDIRLVNPTDKEKITLMTCWPIGTDLRRLIVEGSLTSTH